MDVWFCECRNHSREAHVASCRSRRSWLLRAPPLRASGEVFFLLTMTYMDVGKSSKWLAPNGLMSTIIGSHEPAIVTSSNAVS